MFVLKSQLINRTTGWPVPVSGFLNNNWL